MVQVIVTDDINRNSPIFLFPNIQNNTIKLIHGVQPGTEIVKISAIDKDVNVNGVVKFRILSGNEKNYFYLDPLAGILILNRPLNLQLKNRA